MSLPVIIGAGVFAAYLLGRSKRTDSTSPTISPPAPPKDSNSKTDTNAGTIPENASIGLGTRDVSGDISNEELHPLPVQEVLIQVGEGAVGHGVSNFGLDSKTGIDIANSQAVVGLDDFFFRWFWLPASKVKLSEITPYEWRMSFALLGGSVHRRMDREMRYQAAMLDIKQRQESAMVGSLIAKVGAMVPVIGSVFAAVVQSQVTNVAAQAIGTDARAVGASGSSYRFAVDPKNLDPPAAMLLAPAYKGDGDKKIDTHVMPWLEEQGLNLESTVIPGNVPKKYIGTSDFPWPEFGGVGRFRYAINKRFFTCHQYGIFMPWICDEFFNRQLTTKQQVNFIARVYKAIATLTVMAFPDITIRDPARGWVGRPKPGPWGYSDPVYYYNNPIMGDVLGSIFPPTEEDKGISNSAGYMLNFQGGLYPDYNYDDQIYGGTHWYLPSPRTMAEKDQYDKQYAARVAEGEARKAKSVAESHTAAVNTNFEYLKSLYDRRGQITVDGLDLWNDHQWTWEHVRLLTPQMITDLPNKAFSISTRLFVPTSAMLAEVTVDQKIALNAKIRRGTVTSM